MTLEYVRNDGIVEEAASLAEAYKVCPFLGKMSLEQAAVFVEIYERGAAVLEKEQNVTTREVAPKLDTEVIIVENVKQADKIETVITPAQQIINLDVVRESADIIASLTPIIEDKLDAAPTTVIDKPKTPKTEALASIAKPETALPTSIDTSDTNKQIPLIKESTESVVIEESSQDLALPAATELPKLAQAIEDEPVVELTPTQEFTDSTEVIIASVTEPEASEDMFNQTIALDIEIEPEEQLSQQMMNIETSEVVADTVIVEIAQELETALVELDEVEQVVVNETIEKIVELLTQAVPESETQTTSVFEQLSIEEAAELSELIETLCAAIGYEITDEDLDDELFIQALSQVFPSLKPVLMAVDLERDGTKEAKRQYQWGTIKGSDVSGAIARLSQVIGMLVLLRSFAILPVDIYYQL